MRTIMAFMVMAGVFTLSGCETTRGTYCPTGMVARVPARIPAEVTYTQTEVSYRAPETSYVEAVELPPVEPLPPLPPLPPAPPAPPPVAVCNPCAGF